MSSFLRRRRKVPEHWQQLCKNKSNTMDKMKYLNESVDWLLSKMNEEKLPLSCPNPFEKHHQATLDKWNASSYQQNSKHNSVDIMVCSRPNLEHLPLCRTVCSFCHQDTPHMVWWSNPYSACYLIPVCQACTRKR